MYKPVLIGGGLGLLVLAIAAVVFWSAGPPAPLPLQSPAPLPRQGEALPRTAVPDPAEPPRRPAARHTQDELVAREQLARMRAQLHALQAAGKPASPQTLRGLADTLDAAYGSSLPPEHLRAVRNILETSAQVQALENERAQLGSSQRPEDVARRAAIVTQMQLLAQTLVAEAEKLQALAAVPQPGKAQP